MLCYRDMTFCPYWQDCAQADDCPRPLTDEVRRKAESFKLPIMQFGGKPGCHIPNKPPADSEMADD